ncbi:MAG: NAD-dependent epimerase/dehydratase family protein [Sphingobacteriales bacterium]|nr:NAD-dependent epimerase/dehydratase family protein [Sphingobacteriales bacterium]
MKILILGSEGFIGKHLVHYFQKKNYTVISSDIILKNESNYILINPEAPNFTLLFQKNTYDVCINATGAANVQFSFIYPHTDYFLNTANVFAILDAIRIYNPSCAFINLSSAAVYGNPEYLPIHENTPIKPVSPYGMHKHYSELICKEFFQFYNIKSISIRIFSAYGPGLKKQLLWDLFKKISNSKEQNKIELFGTGNETRDFIYVEDIAYAVDCIINSGYFTGEAINIASGTETSIKSLAEMYIKHFNPNINILFSEQTKIGDPIFWKADITQLKSLGFNPQFNIAEGIKETIEWQKKQLLD